MVKIAWLWALPLLVSTGCACVECKMHVSELVPGVPEYILDNGIVTAKCVPAASGLLSGFEFLPERRQMIEPLGYDPYEDDLLPTRVQVTKTGLRELLQGTKMTFNTPFSVRDFHGDGEHAELVMSSRYFQNEDIEAVKRISIRRGESMARICFSLTPHDGRKQMPALWLNFIAQLGENRDIVYLPVLGGANRRDSRGMLEFTKSGVYADHSLEHQQLYAAPNRSWIARVSPDRPGVLALRTGNDFLKDGYFLSWKHGVSPLHTMEMILPMRRTEGETFTFNYDCLYFSGLRSIRDIAGPFGIDLEQNNLIISTAVPCAAGSLKLHWVNGDGKVSESIEVSLPNLIPGKTVKVSLNGKISDASLRLVGELPGGHHFELFDMIVPRDQSKPIL